MHLHNKSHTDDKKSSLACVPSCSLCSCRQSCGFSCVCVGTSWVHMYVYVYISFANIFSILITKLFTLRRIKTIIKIFVPTIQVLEMSTFYHISLDLLFLSRKKWCNSIESPFLKSVLFFFFLPFPFFYSVWFSGFTCADTRRPPFFTLICMWCSSDNFLGNPPLSLLLLFVLSFFPWC